MILKTLKYDQFKNTSKEWILDEFSPGQINLIVGKNASGKTRTLNIIKNIADLVSGQHLRFGRGLPYGTGNHEFCFDKDGENIKYILTIRDSKVHKEELFYSFDFNLFFHTL